MHIKEARRNINVREKTGHNDGRQIEAWLKEVGLYKGNSYCAAFVSHCLAKAKALEPQVRSGLAIKFITKKSISASDVYKGRAKVPQYCIAVWRRGSTWHGHTGFVLAWHGTKGITIEANTSSGAKGSQSDGDGVYIRQRELQPYAYLKITHFTEVRY